MAKWTIVAYPDEETDGSRKSKIIEAKDWNEAMISKRRAPAVSRGSFNVS